MLQNTAINPTGDNANLVFIFCLYAGGLFLSLWQ